MKIALVNTFSPFIRGGAEILVDDLKEHLEKSGHAVTLFRLPFATGYYEPLLQLALAAKLLDFTAYDRVICFKFPAYCVCHRNKALWLFHQFRQVYDLYGAEGELEESASSLALKTLIAELDNKEIGEAEKVTVITQEIANRLLQYNDLPAEVILPPLMDAEKYHSGEYGDYLYYPSRITGLKRQHLAVEAMRYVQTNIRLVLAGVCSEKEYDKLLRSLIQKYHLEDRVIYENKWVENERKIEEISNCLAVIYTPYLEDSSGFASYEAFYSAKPVLTCTDSGGTKDFVKDGITGYVVEPTPQEIAKKMDALYLEKKKTEEMGENAYNYINKRNITWEETIRRLLA